MDADWDEEFGDEWGLAANFIAGLAVSALVTGVVLAAVVWNAASLAAQAVQAVRHKP